ncbi:SMI1/KNR4 family protein [Paenibacillus sp. JX-17]|uniref:SMI1/KNR4 family protein n=1 Tax=Paenibacillus lacisoli TaxID=3064525 RepID=A0ABT9CJG6_9BACL|nr:SMI1/KNR4 family protein [Paenibacillus sp. JX-17]MDO7907753.1 SMI1/KNR4 family protein [Paenibacillus sp. JX-17]
MYQKQIDRILRKLKQLAALDPALDLFGADQHRYRLAPPWNEDQVRGFEKAWSVTLPENYKAFIMQAGAGGAGPYYGLAEPEEGVYSDLDHKNELNDISAPFPYTDEWNMDTDWNEDTHSEEQLQRMEEQYFSTEHSAGLLRISNFGCGVSMNLVLCGPSCGEIWVDDRVNGNGIFPDHYFENENRLTFLDWYETWLDRSLEELEAQQD